MGILLITSCGCASFIKTGLNVTDSNRLDPVNLQIGWLKFDDTTYTIRTLFPLFVDLLGYLNSTFVDEYGLQGEFTYNGAIITYSNPENFKYAEIMAIVDTIMIRGRIGSPEEVLNESFVQLDNDNVLTVPGLVDCEVLQVTIGSQNAQPITADGYLYDPNAGTLTFPADNYPQNTFIYILAKRNY